MSKPKTFKESLVAWRTMADNLAPRLGDLPYLVDQHAALVAVVARAQRLETQQAVAAAKLRQINHERAVAAREGRALRNRIACGLQAALGVESAKLIEFGVPPRVRRARRQKPKAERTRRAAKAAREAEAGDAAKPGGRGLVN